MLNSVEEAAGTDFWRRALCLRTGVTFSASPPSAGSGAFELFRFRLGGSDAFDSAGAGVSLDVLGFRDLAAGAFGSAGVSLDFLDFRDEAAAGASPPS